MVHYQPTNDGRQRGYLLSYHGSPPPANLNEVKADASDLAGMASRRDLFEDAEGFRSRFTIGFEIEKLRFKRGAVREYALLKGFERDGSCGVEAITHILPLVDKSVWRMKVYNMFVEAQEVIDDGHSPSNYACGGHITLAADGVRGDDLYERLRPFMGLWYALFLPRLRNSYCRSNVRLDAMYNTKYSPLYNKRDGITCELRLPSRVSSVSQLMRRYELCYLMMKWAFDDERSEGQRWAGFMREAWPIVRRMYDGDIDKARNRWAMAKHFRKWLMGGKAHEGLLLHIDPNLRNDEWWNRKALVARRDMGHGGDFTAWVTQQAMALEGVS